MSSTGWGSDCKQFKLSHKPGVAGLNCGGWQYKKCNTTLITLLTGRHLKVSVFINKPQQCTFLWLWVACHTKHSIIARSICVTTFCVTSPNFDVVNMIVTLLVVKTHRKKHFDENNSLFDESWSVSLVTWSKISTVVWVSVSCGNLLHVGTILWYFWHTKP